MTTESRLHQWAEQGDLTLDATNIMVGVVRMYANNEEPPEAPNAVCIQAEVELYGVPLAMVAKMSPDKAQEFLATLQECITAVREARMPDVENIPQ